MLILGLVALLTAFVWVSFAVGYWRGYVKGWKDAVMRRRMEGR